MLNMIRMELFRMFKTKSLYVIWTIFAVLMIVTTALTAGEMDAYSLEDRQQNYEYAMEEQEKRSGESWNGCDASDKTGGTGFCFRYVFCKYKRKGRCGVYDHLYNPVFYGRCNERICEKYSRSSEKQRFDRMCQSRMFVPLYSIDDDVVLHCTGSGKQIVFP